MTRIDGPARQHTHHNPEPDAAGAEHTGKAVDGAKAKPTRAATAQPHEPMSKARRQAVDGLVKRQTPKSQQDIIRAALAKNPGLADHYVALRLRGHNRIEHQIVHAVLARSGTTGVQRLAMCESAVRQIHSLGRSQQADVLGLVTMGVSVHSAIAQLKSEAQSDKAEAAQKSQQSMSRKIDGAVQSLKNEASSWNKTANEVNALYRQVPTLTRQAEVTVGVVNATATLGDLAMAGTKFQYTLDGHAFDEALDKADRSAGYMAGDFTDKVNQARTLYTEFSNQHIAYIEQNHRMQRAIKSGDFQTQLDARARMDKLAAGMKATAARFRPIAEKAVRMDEHFNDDTKAAAKHVVETGAVAGTESLVLRSSLRRGHLPRITCGHASADRSTPPGTLEVADEHRTLRPREQASAPSSRARSRGRAHLVELRRRGERCKIAQAVFASSMRERAARSRRGSMADGGRGRDLPRTAAGHIIDA